MSGELIKLASTEHSFLDLSPARTFSPCNSVLFIGLALTASSETLPTISTGCRHLVPKSQQVHVQRMLWDAQQQCRKQINQPKLQCSWKYKQKWCQSRPGWPSTPLPLQRRWLVWQPLGLAGLSHHFLSCPFEHAQLWHWEVAPAAASVGWRKPW